MAAAIYSCLKLNLKLYHVRVFQLYDQKYLNKVAKYVFSFDSKLFLFGLNQFQKSNEFLSKIRLLFLKNCPIEGKTAGQSK